MRIERALVLALGLLATAAQADGLKLEPGTIALSNGKHIHLLGIPEFPMVAKAPEAANAVCGLKLVESYPMQLDGGDHIVIPLHLDKPRLMIVDTGGVRSTLYASAAKEMNLAPPEDDQEAEIDVRGYSTSSVVQTPNLDFGIIRFHNATFKLIEDSRPIPLADNAIVGTLGPSHLMTFDLDFDFHRGLFNLFAQDHCPGKVVYWAKDYVSVPFEIEGLTHIKVPMTLDGKSVSVTIDTGSPDTFLNMTLAKTLFGLDANSPGMEPAGFMNPEHDPAGRIYRYRFKSLSMAGVEIRNPLVTILPDAIAAQTGGRQHLDDMVLGLRELVQLHLYIAYGERKLYATEAADQSALSPNMGGK